MLQGRSGSRRRALQNATITQRRGQGNNFMATLAADE